MKLSRIMTNTFVLSVSTVLLLSITACNKDNNNNGAGQPPKVAQIPGPTPTYPTVNQCLYQTAPQGNWWPEYSVQPYGSPLAGYGQPQFNPFPQGYICGCPMGYMPTCSPQGLLCMPMQYMNRYVITWSWHNGNFSPQHRAINPYVRWYRAHYGERDRWGRQPHYRPHPGPRPMPPRYGGHPGGRMVLDTDNETDVDDETTNEPTEDQPTQNYGNQGGANCSINSVAQMCQLMPNQPPPVVNGMVCMPLAAGSGQGIWVRQ